MGIHDPSFPPAEQGAGRVIGIEAAGIVSAVGPSVTSCCVGDRVAVVSVSPSRGGVWAQYAAVPGDSLILPIPDGVSFEQAAAVPVAAGTALRALRALPDGPAGRRLFIAGASGAVGTFTVPLARREGWVVAASASAPNHDHLRDLGAELTVDYRDPSWIDEVLRWRRGGVEAAISIPPGTTHDAMATVRDGGAVVTVSADDVPGVRGITVGGLAYGAEIQEDLRALMEGIASGTTHVEIERVYPFAEALSALAEVRTLHARGKVVLRRA